MNILSQILIQLNNREKAVIFLTTLLVAWAISKKEIRSSALKVVKAFLAPKVIIPLICLSCYIVLVTWLLSIIGFWKIYLLKDTLIWFFGFASVLFLTSNKAYENENHLQTIFLGYFKLFVVIQFVVNT